MKYEVKILGACSDRELRRLRELTLVGSGESSDSVMRFNLERVDTYSLKRVVLARAVGLGIVGWALLRRSATLYYPVADLMLFVDPICRKRGIGRRLIEEAKRAILSSWAGVQHFEIYPWDRNSRAFYRAVFPNEQFGDGFSYTAWFSTGGGDVTSVQGTQSQNCSGGRAGIHS